MKSARLLSILSFLALCIHIGFSYLTQFKLVNTSTVGEISDKYPSLFTPAGITFAIWGVIYISLIAFSIYHILLAWTRPENHSGNIDQQKIGGWFIFNNLAAAAWLIAWTREMILLSVFLIFFQLLSLIIINMRLCIYDRKRSAIAKLFTQFPLSIYFAWITIATIANTSSYLNALGWNPIMHEITWTVLMITIAVLITVLVVMSRRNVLYGLVVIWALFGIVLKRMSVDEIQYFEIIRAAWIGISIISVVCALQFARNLISRKSRPIFPLSPHPVK